MSIGVWAAVAGVGGAGAVLRFVIDAEIGGRLGRGFPFGTLVINLTGAFVLGLVTGAGLTGNALLIAGTATIGSYTTFSTWMLESQRLVEDAQTRPALVNLFGSLLAGLAAALLGKLIGGAL